MQARLQNLGFYHGELDGKIDDEMKQALEEFQAAVGLTVTGKLDGPTRVKLFRRHDQEHEPLPDEEEAPEEPEPEIEDEEKPDDEEPDEAEDERYFRMLETTDDEDLEAEEDDEEEAAEQIEPEDEEDDQL